MLKELLMVFLVSFGVAFLLMPVFIKLAKKFRLVDKPNERKIHTHPMPTLGGVIIYLAFMAGIFLSLSISPGFAAEFNEYLLSLYIGGSAILLLGILHDTIDIQPVAKLLGQIIAGLILFINGIKIEVITNPFGGQIYLSQELSMLLTVGWVVAVINAINLVDGLDGLASGITIISAIVLFLIAYLRQELSSLFLIAALIGATLGFLRYNFHPARIFMGDTGSMFLGFILSILSILGINKMATTVALLVPIAALGIPIYDTASVVFRRLIMKKNVMVSDRKHLHYRLLEMGVSHKQVVLFLYAVAIYFGLISFLMARLPSEYAFILLLLLSMGVFLGMRAMGFMERKIRALPKR